MLEETLEDIKEQVEERQEDKTRKRKLSQIRLKSSSEATEAESRSLENQMHMLLHMMGAADSCASSFMSC